MRKERRNKNKRNKKKCFRREKEGQMATIFFLRLTPLFVGLRLHLRDAYAN